MTAIYWWVIALVLGVSELLSGTFFMLMLALAAALTALAAHAGVSGWPWQVALFAILSVGLTAFWRRHRPRVLRVQDNALNQGAGRWVGRELVLTEGISAGSGRAALDDSFWNVRGPDCAPGTRARIVSVDGNTLVVELL